MTPSDPGAVAEDEAWPVTASPIHRFDTPVPAPPLLVRRPPGQTRPPATDFRGNDVRLAPVHALSDGTLQGADVTIGRVGLDTPWTGRSRPSSNATHHATLLRAACEQAQLCKSPLILSVPLPLGTACDSRLVVDVTAALSRAEVPPWRIEIGFGAPVLVDAGAHALLALSALRDLGVGLALDRVDSVPAMLRKLRRLPLTCVRLHACLMPDLSHSRDIRNIAAEAIDVAHELDAVVVATGVRTVLQRDILADMLCDAAQGPLFGSPMPAGVFRAAMLAPPGG